MFTRPILFPAALILGALTIAPVAAQHLRPFDGAAKDSSFLKYRTALISALRKGDIDYVVAQASPKILLDFGGGRGRGTFRKNLLGDQAVHGSGYKEEARAYRSALRRMLRLGGAFLMDKRGVRFVAPYVEAWGNLVAQAKRQGRKVKDPTAG